MLCIHLGKKIGERRSEVCSCHTSDPEILYIGVFECSIFGKCTKTNWKENKLPVCTKCSYRKK